MAKTKQSKAKSKVSKASKYSSSLDSPTETVYMTLSVRQATPICPILDFIVEVPEGTSTTKHIESMIFKQHGKSIDNIRMCINRYHPDEIVEKSEKLLKDIGVKTGCIIYYDFDVQGQGMFCMSGCK
jgi:hypothetical protein